MTSWHLDKETDVFLIERSEKKRKKNAFLLIHRQSSPTPNVPNFALSGTRACVFRKASHLNDAHSKVVILKLNESEIRQDGVLFEPAQYIR